MEETSQQIPQFGTAEFTPGNATRACASCRRPIDGDYFQINGASACPECARKIQALAPADSHAAYIRALAFGIAGAIAGFVVYVTFALLTGLVIGWVSLAVGFIVGKAMNFGSRGVGGRRYQITAALLTYLAVSMSAVPIAIHQMQQHKAEIQARETSAPPNAPGKVLKATGALILVGIASPLLDLQSPLQGVIGLVILFVGMRFAWRFTAGRRIVVSGPHNPSPAGVV